jgi:hypothetical protein
MYFFGHCLICFVDSLPCAVFRLVLNSVVRLLESLGSSAHLYACNNSEVAKRIFIKYYIEFIKNVHFYGTISTIALRKGKLSI